MNFFLDLTTFLKFLKIQKNYKRIFFFENSFIESHLEPYIKKNKNFKDTAIISFYNIDNENLKRFKIFNVKSYFFLNLFFLFLNIKFCYSSTPDLDNSAFKKTVLKKTIYIYIQHSPLGLSQIYRDNAFNNFDIVQAVNVFQENDLKEINFIKQTKIKIWRSKYLFFESKKKINLINNEKKKILIAPTWSTNFFKDNIYLLIKKNLDFKEYDIYLRPHFMSIKNQDINIKTLINENFKISTGKLDFKFYDILITDWSGIYIEFAKINNVKSVLIEIEPKILNKNIYEFKKETIDIFARKKLGIMVKVNELSNLKNIIKKIIKEKKDQSNQVEEFFNLYFF